MTGPQVPPSTPNFQFTDKRGRTASGLQAGNLNEAMNTLRQSGYTLPRSNTQARAEALNVAQQANNRNLKSTIDAERLARARIAGNQPGVRTASNMMQVAPKQRTPMGTLADKGIPFNFESPKELSEIRRWARLFYACHDLVPLLIDIYSKFPLIGLEFECLAAETPVITSGGTFPIGELSGGVHRVLTTGGKWVEAPFKSFGEKPLMRVVVQRNGRQREFFATPNHRWFVEEHHKPRLGRTGAKWSSLTWERVDRIRVLRAQGSRQVDLARDFDVSQVMISKIVNGHSWTEEQRAAEQSCPIPGWHKTEVLTEDLRQGMRLVSSYARSAVHSTNPSPFGIAHGMTFGDGSKNTSGGGCHVDLYGDKDANMLPYFTGCTVYRNLPSAYEGNWTRVTDLPRYFKDRPLLTESTSYLYGWLAGYFAADGTVSKKGEVFLDSARLADIEHVQAVCQLLGIHASDPYVIERENGSLPRGGRSGAHTMHRLRLSGESLTGDFFCIPGHRTRWTAHADRKSHETWTVVAVEKTDRVEEVYCAVVPGTEAFTLAGNILTHNSKDNEIRDFYTTMFMDGLDYANWLPNAFAREYFISGEVTALAHFNEQLGTWASEEILNPDMLDVSRSMLVDRERVQLRVKEMIDNLRTGPGGVIDTQETESQRQERLWQYKILEQYYPEIMHAATKDDGLDLSEALVSRIVNKVSSWDLRGTPPLLRSFRTLMSEESLNAAQDAISDRLYSPFILAKLGVPDLGDGGPWIPDQTDLDNVRDDINNALMADLRVVVGNFSLDIESVFGREAMPRFDSDYDRIDRKLMQAWGIGEELISGGNSSTYAGTAINREFVTQQMVTFQNLAKNHIVRRAEVIAEAQEHYDYEKKGAYRRPLYREIVETDPMTGEEHLVRVPKLLIPDVKFETLNLRDEATERAFLMELYSAGVPISNRTMALNIDIDFESELERSSEETYQKLIAQAQTMAKVQSYCDTERKPYPPELVQHLSATLQLRQAMGQTTMLEDQAKQMAAQAAQASPAGQLGILPGTVAQPAPPAEGQTEGGPPVPRDPSAPQPPFESGQPAPQLPGAMSPQVMAASLDRASGVEVAGHNGHRLADTGKVKTPGVPVAAPPTAAPPTASPPKLPGVPINKTRTEVPRNRTRPPESDEMRGTTARKRQRRRKSDNETATGKLTRGPSSWRASHLDVTTASQADLDAQDDRVIAAVRRRQRIAEHRPESSLEHLMDQPLFWEATEKRAYRDQILNDLPEILALHGDYERMDKSVRTSARLLDEALDQYEYIFGCVVERPDSE